MAEGHRGITRAKELYLNRDYRARELKEEGKKVVGYYCIYVPLEMMHAAGIVPFRIWGSMQEPPSLANNYFIDTSCFYARSCFELGLKGAYDFLDGIVGCFTCDTFERMFQIWRYHIKLPYSHVVAVPHAIHTDPPISLEFFIEELNYFRKSLENFTGKKISDQSLSRSVKPFNEHRALVRELSSLRKKEPPFISGSEVEETIIASMTLPVEEANKLLREVIAETRNSAQHPQNKAVRILIWGTPLDDVAITRLIEESGANVVVEDVCTGMRPFLSDVEATDDPLEGIATRYMDKLTCPIACREAEGTHKEDLDRRLGYLKAMAKDYQVNAAIIQVVSYCCIHLIDALNVKDYLREEAGIPSLIVEHDYNKGALAPLKTRIQAFLETMG